MATRFAGWLRILLVMIGGASLAGWLFARYVWLARGRLPATARRSRLEIDDGTSIALAHISQCRDHVVVLAHGFLKRKDDLRIIRLASSLLQQFDVILFDQPGHGDSTGLADMDIATAGDILARIAVEARRLGYVRVSAVGVSLGAAAAIHAASAGSLLDAVVSISSPVVSPSPKSGVWRLGLLRCCFRALGTRVGDELSFCGEPLAAVAGVAPCPLLIVHCGRDTLLSRADSERLFRAAREPKAWLLDEHALHGTPNRSHRQIVAWLDDSV